MATASLYHSQLNATFNGVQTESTGIKTNKFKGIKYAHIPARFEKSQLVLAEELNGQTIDATQYGYVYRTLKSSRASTFGPDFIKQRPRCPQVDIDVRHLLRIPEDYQINEEPEDELECLNLDVTVPAETAAGRKLPVFIWIYGK
jgi:carboxylesterase type B